jgi:hypothetical protein
VSPDFSEVDKIAFAIKLLPALGVIVSSELEIVTRSVQGAASNQSLYWTAN